MTRIINNPLGSCLLLSKSLCPRLTSRDGQNGRLRTNRITALTSSWSTDGTLKRCSVGRNCYICIGDKTVARLSYIRNGNPKNQKHTNGKSSSFHPPPSLVSNFHSTKYA